MNKGEEGPIRAFFGREVTALIIIMITNSPELGWPSRALADTSELNPVGGAKPLLHAGSRGHDM